MSTVTDPLTHVTHYGYDNDNHRTSVTSPLAAQAQTTQYGYNARGEKTSLTDAATFAINYTYDDNGNPGQVLNRNGGPFNSVYYGDNRLFTSQTPLGKTTTFTYIKRGMPATVVKPSQQGTSLNTTFSYDDRGRLTGKVDPVGSSVYTPDPDNNVLTHTENGKTITRVYEDVNRLTSYTDEGGNQIGYQYDNNGNLLKLTYPGNKAVNYVYDSNNRLTTVTDWAGRVTSITYDLAGRVLSVTRPNNTVRNIGYDDAGETTQIQELMPSPNGLVPIAYYKLVYDEAGRMTNEFIAPLPTAYTEPAETVVPDADNRILTFNGLTVVHDPDGNMTSGPLNGNSLVTHVYDARNRLTSVGASGTAPALSYGYDSEGNRTSVTQGTQTTRYVVNPAGSQVLIRTRADGTQTFYVYGLGLLYDVEMTSAGVETGMQHTYHYDSRGSTIAVTSAAGLVTDRVQYSVYGRITLRTGSTDTLFLFNGRYGVQTDANGLYYMRARYYNSYICRFINADPAGFGGGMNWYAFADGNPVSLTDPFGLGTQETGANHWGIASSPYNPPLQDFVGGSLANQGLPSQPISFPTPSAQSTGYVPPPQLSAAPPNPFTYDAQIIGSDGLVGTPAGYQIAQGNAVNYLTTPASGIIMDALFPHNRQLRQLSLAPEGTWPRMWDEPVLTRSQEKASLLLTLINKMRSG